MAPGNSRRLAYYWSVRGSEPGVQTVEAAMPDVRVSVNRNGDTASEGHVRGHRVVMDRPEEKGGGNQGPMGGETMLCALGGCFMSNLVAAAQARDVALGDVGLDIVGTTGGNPPVYERIDMTVSATAQSLDKLVQIAERGCIVANTLKQGVPVTVTVRRQGPGPARDGPQQ